MKILVTGGTGFIGSHTVVELFAAGHTPVVIDNFANSGPRVLKGIEAITGKAPIFFEGDCGDKAFLETVFKTHADIEGVIHFAADKAVGESVQNPLKYYRNNVGSTVTLIETMIAHKIELLAFSSSCTVYGQPDELPVTEESPVLPAMSPYGNTKQVCEEVIQDTVKSGAALKALSLRYFNPIGAHPSAEIGELPNGVPMNLVPFITQSGIGLRGALKVFGTDYDTADGTCVRDYIHIVDLAQAHIRAIEVLAGLKQVGPWYDFVNVGTGTGSTVLEVIKSFEQVSGQKLAYELVDRRPGDVEKIWAKVDKSVKLLNWKTQKTLAEAMADAWRWEQKLATERNS